MLKLGAGDGGERGAGVGLRGGAFLPFGVIASSSALAQSAVGGTFSFSGRSFSGKEPCRYPYPYPYSFPYPTFPTLPPHPRFPDPFPLPIPFFSAPFSLLPCPYPDCCWGSCIWECSCPRLGLFCL